MSLKKLCMFNLLMHIALVYDKYYISMEKDGDREEKRKERERLFMVLRGSANDNDYPSDEREFQMVQKQASCNFTNLDILVNGLPILICCFDYNGVLTFVNDTYCQYFNTEKEELIGRDFFQFIPEEDRQTVRDHFRSLTPDNPSVTYDHHVVTPERNIRWQQWTDTALYDNGGNFIEYQSVGRDITEQKITTDQLRQSELKYRLVTENIPVAVYSALVDEQFTTVFMTGQCKEITGYSANDFLDDPEVWMSIIHSDDIQRVKNLLEEHKENREPLNAVYRIITKDREAKWIRNRATMVFDESQRPVRTDGFIEDITEYWQSEIGRRESEAMFRSLVDTMPDSAMIVEYSGTVLFCNNAHRRLMEAESGDKISGKNVYNFFQGEFQERVIENLKIVKQGIDLKKEEFRIRTLRGNMRWIEALGTRIPYKGDSAVLITIRDITDRKEHEAERERLRAKLEHQKIMESLGQMAGGIAHDLNNVLVGLVSYPDLMLMQVSEDSPLRKSLETIRKSGEKAAAIVNDMLAIARRISAKKHVIDLNMVIADQLDSPEIERLKFFHPAVTIKTSLAADLYSINGSGFHLAKTVMNLVSNAAEAMPDGGVILITTENKCIAHDIDSYNSRIPAGDYVLLSVSDTGGGMTKKEKERIFEPFFTKKKMGRSGTGLGMTVIWGTVQDHQGFVDIESEINKGTTFTIYLPATRKKLPIQKSSLPYEDYRGNGESILVVDDVQEQREVALKMLDKLGYKVRAVSSGEEAVEYLKDNPVDLVFLDMIMDPGIDGLETYQQILMINPGQKAVIVSGYSETHRVKKIKKLGAESYLKKPYLLEEIGMTVKKELGNKSLNTANI